MDGKVGRHDAIKVQCNAQLELANKVGESATVKREVLLPEVNEELLELVKKYTTDGIAEVTRGALNKKERKEKLSEIKDSKR